MATRRFAQVLLWLLLAAAFAAAATSRAAAGAAVEAPGGAAPLGEESRPWEYEPGRAVRRAPGYIEFVPGDGPVIVSAPHGGLLQPEELPDRRGVTDRDVATDELARLFVEEFHRETGMRPHLVINLLHRRKLDANRPAGEAAEGNPVALEAWTDFHRYIEEAKAYALERFGWGFYIDLHGHSHDHGRVELGYALSADVLRLTDEGLSRYAALSTLRPVCPASEAQGDLATLLRGTRSLGALLEARGVPSVPSPEAPAPEPGWAYFSGGYNVERHGARDGGTIHGVQIEVSREWRRNPEDLVRFARALAHALAEFLEEWFAPCRYLRLRSAETGAALSALALPAGAERVDVYLDGGLVYSGTIPEEIALSTVSLAQGRHEVAAVTYASGERVGRVEAPLLVRHFTLDILPSGVRLAGEAGSLQAVRGALEIELKPEHAHVEGAAVELRSLQPGGARAELARTGQLPLRFTLETRAFEDGAYELAARVATAGGVEATEVVTLVFDNWEVLEDELLPPVESAWFGAKARLKAVASEGEWGFAAGDPELFAGDDSRLVPEGGGIHHLVWRLPGLESVEVTLYTSTQLEGALRLQASPDGASWTSLSHAVIAEEALPGDGGWRRMVLLARAGEPSEYLRLELDPRGLAAGAVQIGRVRLTGRKG